MGYSERSYSYSFGDPSGGGGGGLGRLFGSVTPWVRRLLIANGAIWLLMFVGLLPNEWAIRTFGSSPEGFLTRPWSPLTYMFIHGGFWHVLVNMFVLFFFGPPLERAWGGRGFLKYYLIAGLGGALGSLAFLPLPAVRPDTLVVGASGAIFGLMLAFALLWPDAKIYIWGILPMRAKWFVAIIAGVTLWTTFTEGGGGGVAHWAHLGGLITGFAYLKWGDGLSRALDPIFDRAAALWPGGAKGSGGRAKRRGGGGPSISGRRRTRGPGGGGRSRSKKKKGASAGRVLRFGSDSSSGEDTEPTSEEMLDEVDRILDKIREDGLDSLSDEEREFLDEMSKRYRG